MASHVEDELSDYALGLVDEQRHAAVADHLAECDRCRAKLAVIERALRAMPPQPRDFDAVRSLIVGAAGLQHHGSAIATLFDVGAETARALLSKIDDEAAWLTVGPGAQVLPVHAGPRCAGALSGFGRLQPGAEFAFHEHSGLETVLVLQGGYISIPENKELWRGETDVNHTGSAHAVRALIGVPCIVASVLFGKLPFKMPVR